MTEIKGPVSVRQMADEEDRCVSQSVGGLAVDLGMHTNDTALREWVDRLLTIETAARELVAMYGFESGEDRQNRVNKLADAVGADRPPVNIAAALNSRAALAAELEAVKALPAKWREEGKAWEGSETGYESVFYGFADELEAALTPKET